MIDTKLLNPMIQIMSNAEKALHSESVCHYTFHLPNICWDLKKVVKRVINEINGFYPQIPFIAIKKTLDNHTSFVSYDDLIKTHSVTVEWTHTHTYNAACTRTPKPKDTCDEFITDPVPTYTIIGGIDLVSTIDDPHTLNEPNMSNHPSFKPSSTPGPPHPTAASVCSNTSFNFNIGGLPTFGMSVGGGMSVGVGVSALAKHNVSENGKLYQTGQFKSSVKIIRHLLFVCFVKCAQITVYLYNWHHEKSLQLRYINHVCGYACARTCDLPVPLPPPPHC